MTVSCLNPMVNVGIFALVGNQSDWIQDASCNQPLVGCGSKISSLYKIFAMLSESVLQVCQTVASL